MEYGEMMMQSESIEATTQIDREMVGEKLQVGEYVIQPVARLLGKVWLHPDGGAQAAVVRINPTEVHVFHQDGSEHHLSIPATQNQALQGMALGALALAGICLLIMAAARLLSHRQPPQGVSTNGNNRG